MTPLKVSYNKSKSDVFIDALYVKLKELDSNINYEIDRGTNLISISFNLDKVRPYYMFQIEKSAKVSELNIQDLKMVRRGNKAVIRLKP